MNRRRVADGELNWRAIWLAWLIAVVAWGVVGLVTWLAGWWDRIPVGGGLS